MRKIVFPQESNLQPLDYRSTALPLELVAFRPEARKTIKILKLWPANVKKKNILIDLLLQSYNKQVAGFK